MGWVICLSLFWKCWWLHHNWKHLSARWKNFNVTAAFSWRTAFFQKHIKMYLWETTLKNPNQQLLLLIRCFANWKKTQKKTDVFSGIMPIALWDHLPYFSILDILKKKQHKPKLVKVNNTDESSFHLFYSYVARSMQTLPCTQTFSVIRMKITRYWRKRF